MVGMQLQVQSRKARRKEERSKKKQHKRGRAEAPVEDPQPPKKVKKVAEKSKKSVEATHKKKAPSKRREDDKYGHLDPDVADAMRRDDQEIEDLERMLGISKGKKEKQRLGKEYAKLEGYGDDFGDFLDGLDNLQSRLRGTEEYRQDMTDSEGEEVPFESDSEDDDEEVPMKDPVYSDLDEDDSVMEELQADEGQGSDESLDQEVENDDESEEDEVEDQTSQGSEGEDDHGDDDSNSEEEEPDHDESLTYRPARGEDIYGNVKEATKDAAKPSKYVPPHMRKKDVADDSERRQESLRTIRRSLNNALNRLSEDTLLSVAQAISALYPQHPTADVNECIWSNMKSACISSSNLMTGIIPIYMAAFVGAHFQKGDSAQLGEFLMETVVLELWRELESARIESDAEAIGKVTSNLVLLVCYMYNYGIVHCSLIYDLVRRLVDSFTEVDVELLLLILGHSGRSLRSDDPSALKEIVLLVQKRSADKKSDSSRFEFMINAMMDLKNNKRRKQDAVYEEKVQKNRKMIGRIKSQVAASNGGFRTSDASLRIGLEDLLNAETKGRWWKVGASWVGNQHRFHDGNDGTGNSSDTKEKEATTEEDARLLKLATKYRMNTDIRRSIFCIVMGSMDYEDAFEKLVRAGMLKSRTERDTVRVIMECCGQEKAYNKYYSHLSARICEYQQSCKFTFQLAFFDAFKQFEEMKIRKVANLAKLLFQLIVDHHCLKLNVLKAIDMSSPEDLPEAAMIFLTILFTSIMEHFHDPVDVAQFFESSISRRKVKKEDLEDEDDMGAGDESEALRASMTVFFVQILKASPKYKKGSAFRKNLKAAIKACDTENFF